VILIIRPPGGGKITELIKMSHNTSQRIVVHTAIEALRVAAVAQKAGYEILHPLTYHDLTSPGIEPGAVRDGVLVDNVSLFVNYLSHRFFKGIPINAITVDNDSEISITQ